MKRTWMKITFRGPNEALAKTSYEEGNQLFLAKRYAEAAKKYKVAYVRWPDSSLEEDAMFMTGEAQFFADKYYRSSDTFTDLLKKYENSKYLDRIVVRYFAIGRYWEAGAKDHFALAINFTDSRFPFIDYTGNAIACYEAIRLNDPTGPLSDDALFASANAYFMQNRFEDADYHYDLLRKEYPRSPHQIPAHLLGLRAKLRTYQGAEYDERPLAESDKLIEATLTQFVGEIPEERDRLIRAQKAIRAQRAEREWENGEYYYNRKYYRAARYYYASLLKTYPDSHFAEMAQARLEETKDLPPVPKNYFAWLGRIFGERRRDFR
jgi:outer membrane protein assembly factor BamD (BamD/ComL family)